MSEAEKKSSKNLTVNYLPATLRHTAHGWTIEYAVLNPASMAMERKVSKMNRIRSRFERITDFKNYCNGVICTLNTRLAGGWTPFGEEQNSRLFTPIDVVLECYINEKSKELRPDTIINYRSFCKCLKEWVDKICPNAQVSMFNKVMAVKFMDYIQNEKGLAGRSYNNRLKQARAFFGWAVEKCYTKENPFVAMKMKREETKQRILIPADTRGRIVDYFSSNNPNYLVLCRLVFSSLVRPKEVWRLRISDIHLSEGYIWVTEDEAKTHFSRAATLTPQLISDIAGMIKNAKPSMYLFGHGFKPDVKPIRYQNFREEWDKMRKALKLPQQMQLYSLRDTGINEMLKSGIDTLTVMQHADHHDLAITTKYANHIDPHLVEVISKRAPTF